ncbi:MAG: hypothetical protein JNM31_05890 [Flavobacteriales bacterium]|nr:hypothetical protein [Flavobacteriales bacterium]
MVHALCAQSILQRRVTIQAEQVRLATALNLLAREAQFKLSYNAAVVPADSLVNVRASDERVDQVLKQLLPPGVRWKESGQHLIITGAVGPKQRFNAEGSVVDGATRAPIARASVLEVRRTNAGSTDEQGHFRLELSGELDRTPLLISRKGYRDTVVFVGREGQVGRVALRPLDSLEFVAPICLYERCGVEDLGVARLLVPSAQMDQSANLVFVDKRPFQLSLLPTISTNGPISGSVINHFSVNLLGGYARGLEGFEIGGAVNIESHDVSGMQIAGLANLVGGRTKGMQIGGAINHTMRSLEGLQLAGLANTVWDTLAGVQIAGGVSVVKNGMTGTQVSGLANISWGALDGVQVAGGVNITRRAVNKVQVSGLGNYAERVEGAQVSAGVNVTPGDVGGAQVGALGNYARSVGGGQVSAGVSIARDEVSGGQVGVLGCFAQSVTGGQAGVCLNVVLDSVSGGQVGVLVNYAGNVSGGQVGVVLNVVPGTVDGGQVGLFNFARRAYGGQVGLFNFSDTLSGGAVGLFTFSRTGYHRVDLSTGDEMALSIHFRTGTRLFHNILGYSPRVTPDQRWGFLYGVGTEPRLGESGFMNIDLTAEQVVEQRDWVEAANILGRLSVSYGVDLHGRFALSAGPLLNVLFSDWRDPDTGTYLSALPPAKPMIQGSSGDLAISGWLGWKATLGWRF